MRKAIVRITIALTLIAGIASYSAPQVMAGGGGTGNSHCSGC